MDRGCERRCRYEKGSLFSRLGDTRHTRLTRHPVYRPFFRCPTVVTPNKPSHTPKCPKIHHRLSLSMCLSVCERRPVRAFSKTPSFRARAHMLSAFSVDEDDGNDGSTSSATFDMPGYLHFLSPWLTGLHSAVAKLLGKLAQPNLRVQLYIYNICNIVYVSVLWPTDSVTLFTCRLAPPKTAAAKVSSTGPSHFDSYYLLTRRDKRDAWVNCGTFFFALSLSLSLSLFLLRELASFLSAVQPLIAR